MNSCFCLLIEKKIMLGDIISSDYLIVVYYR